MSQWIKQPLVDINHVRERLDVVEVFVNDTNLRLQVADENLQKFPDFFKYVSTVVQVIQLPCHRFGFFVSITECQKNFTGERLHCKIATESIR